MAGAFTNFKIMAFEINGEFVNLKGNTANARMIRAQMDELIKMFNLKDGGRIHIGYPKELIKENPDNPGKPDKPASVVISYQASFLTDHGMDTIKYYKTVRISPNGEKIYDPPSFEFRGSSGYDIKKLEEAVFIIYYCPRTKNGANQDHNKVAYMEVEDLAGDARIKIEAESEMSYIIHLVTGGEKRNGLSDKKVRKIAGAFFIPNAHSDNIYIVKDRLLDIVKRDHDGMDKFLKYTGMKEAPSSPSEIKSNIQMAVDKKIIRSEDKGDSKRWRFLDEKGMMTSVICPISQRMDAKEELFKYYRENTDKYLLLLHELKVEIVEEVEEEA